MIYKLTENFKNLAKRNDALAKFLVVGSFNTVLDLAIFFVLANLIYMNPVPANILSTGFTMCVSFFLNHRYVFRSRKKKRHTALQFVAVTLFNVWLVQSLIIYLVVRLTEGTHLFSGHAWTLNLFAKLSGVCVSFILNFVLYKYIFHNKPLEEAAIL
jgi:putative flippase GtrA